MLLPLSSLFLFIASASAQGPPPEPEEPSYVTTMTGPIDLCPDERSKEMFKTQIEVDIHNATTSFMDGSLFINKEITFETTAELTLMKEENGQSKLMMSACLNMCEEIMNPESDYIFILQYIKFGGACPLESGEYRVDNLIIDVSSIELKEANKGNYIAKITMFEGACDDKDRKELGCVSTSFCIE